MADNICEEEDSSIKSDDDGDDEVSAVSLNAAVSDEGQSLGKKKKKSSTSSRRLLRATMSLANFEEQAHEDPVSSNSRMIPGATVATPEEFVNKFGGKRVINKILIANNGIAAVKCIRSIRRWSYETFLNERAVKFVVMVTPEDLKANADYIKMADFVCKVKGGSNNNNYANVDLIVSVAKQHKVEAVWAGWGHASENPKLPASLSKNGIMFMGPSEAAMWMLGDKIASSIVAQTAGVPTLPWSGSGLTAPMVSLSGSSEGKKRIKVNRDLYGKGCVHTLEEGLLIAQKIGYPVMIKASEGGGGKGIRKAESSEEFQKQYSQVKQEVPGSPIFIMKLAKNARHLEVQLLADEEGTAISLFGRDCSIQRRHQKIIEEAPVIIAKPEVIREMEKAAVKLAEMVDYRSAGTVEYLYDGDSGKWYFLELNPRLQVEHPCTEMISNINLPAAQLMVAMGIPLRKMKAVRQMYHACLSQDSIDFHNPEFEPKPMGHVIAARITSENPDEGFKPSAGTVHEINFKSNKNVWGYFSVSASGGLHEFADSQFGHCFSWGEDREQARENLVVALKELSIRGDFRTIVEHLIMLLEKKEFLDNSLNTGWLDELIAKKEKSDKPNIMLSLICGALCVAEGIITSNFETFKASLERGQTQPATILKNSVNVDLIHEGMKYCVRATKTGKASYMMELNESKKDVEVFPMTDGQLLVLVDGLTHTTYMQESADSYRVAVGNQTVLFSKENDPSILMAPSTGKLIKYLHDDGGHVKANEPFCEIEVMKMVTTLHVSQGGVIQFVKRPGAILENGSVIAKLTLDDNSQCCKVEEYQGPGFDMLTTSEKPAALNLHQNYLNAKLLLENVLDGFCPSNEKHFKEFVAKLIEDYLQILRDPRLPLDETREVLASIQGRITPKLEREIVKALSSYEQNITSVLAQFPAQKINNAILDYLSRIDTRERDIVELTLEPIMELCSRYRGGARGHMKMAICDIIKRYTDVEKQFQIGHYDKVVTTMRSLNKDNVQKVVDTVFAHTQVRMRNIFITSLLDSLWKQEPRMTKDIKSSLLDLANLSRGENSTVSLKARTILIASEKPSYELRYNKIEKLFLDAISANSIEQLETMIADENAMFDVLGDFFYHLNRKVRVAALEVYERRALISYDIEGLLHDEIGPDDNISAIVFKFRLPETHPNSSHGGHQEHLFSCHYQRFGAMAAFENFQQFRENFLQFLGLFRKRNLDEDYRHDHLDLDHIVGSPQPQPALSLSFNDSEDKWARYHYILNVGVRMGDNFNDNEISRVCSEFCEANSDILREHEIRRVTFIVLRSKEFPKYFTFRARMNYKEDLVYRHLEPALAFQLELNRLKNYDLFPVPVSNHKMHLYFATAKKLSDDDQQPTDHRFFIRSIIRHTDLVTTEASFEFVRNEGERLLLEALDELEVAFTLPQAKTTDGNHIFLNFVPTITMHPLNVAKDIEEKILNRYAHRLLKLKVKFAEISLSVRPAPNVEAGLFRICISNEAGYLLKIHIYKVEEAPDTGILKFFSFSDAKFAFCEYGPMHCLPVSTPYITKAHTETKRSKALALETTYAYDFPDLFKNSLIEVWREHRTHCQVSTCVHPLDSEVCSYQELVLDEDGKSVTEGHCYPGHNTIGIVAWKLDIKTPEYPKGREVVVIANDISHLIGSFGPKEDLMFKRASEYARSKKIPRVYIASNSGARIGLANELLSVFRVAWEDPEDPEKGFKYLYLSPDDYQDLTARGQEGILQTQLIQDENENRYKITAIIGLANDIGVENLSGAGMIAGETSQAYDEVVTMAMVTGRAIGIGAYLVRLSQRVVQVDNSAIILTGYTALNKLLGREVYTSNTQLGGVQIMHNNGVSHATVHNDIEGVRKLVRWLSYIPKRKGASLPVHLESKDEIDRIVGYKPRPNEIYDPRWLLEGQINENGLYESGFFDRGSFDEIMAGWAKTVVTGRARLGGIPVGVIAVETRTIEVTMPADPANPESEAKIVSQAGQVWFPDSAHKTAQAIFDFNREELPLIIFANWRGFSGGMKDMYEEVVKFGAKIVDALNEFNQPIIIYLPPFAELRGGSWVVIDPTINPTQMEMYADPEARGGVLEPEGIVSIKLRMKDQRLVMQRLDPEMKRLMIDVKNASDPENKSKLEAKVRAREEILCPIYHQVAVQFADLHDTPARMMAKGVIRDVIPWRESRTKLYWRLKRRLFEKKLMSKIEKTGANLNHGQKTELLRRWFTESERAKFSTDKFTWDDDKPVAEWLRKQLKEVPDIQVVKDNLKVMRMESMMTQLRGLFGQMADDELHEAGIYLAQKMTSAKKEEFVEAVRQVRSLKDGTDLEASNAIKVDKADDKKDDSSASENGEAF
uniref:ACC n=1 Tax=Paracyclopina nana TaxID=565004 RepID=A0A1L3THU7_PARNA|nr:ACC [Paracyclopina nana]